MLSLFLDLNFWFFEVVWLHTLVARDSLTCEKIALVGYYHLQVAITLLFVTQWLYFLLESIYTGTYRKRSMAKTIVLAKNTDARQQAMKLDKYVGERHCFTGVFSRYGWYVYEGDPKEKHCVDTVILRNVQDDTGEITAMHVQFHLTKGFSKLSLVRGDVISFTGKIVKKYYSSRDIYVDDKLGIGYEKYIGKIFSCVEDEDCETSYFDTETILYKISFPSSVKKIGNDPNIDEYDKHGITPLKPRWARKKEERKRAAKMAAT